MVAGAPDDPAGYASLAQVHLMAGRTAEAETWIRRALRRAPDDVTVHLLQAKALEARGRPDRARAELERLATREPPDPRVLFALADLAEATGEPASAAVAGHLGRAAELVPGNSPVRVRLAQTLTALGETDGALGQVEELLRLFPALPDDAEAALAQATYALRDADAAAAADALARLRAALELTPFYQAELRRIQGPRGELAGVPVLIFSPLLGTATPETVADLLTFTDVTTTAGLTDLVAADAVSPPVVAVGDWDGDGTEDLFVSGAAPGTGRPVARLLRGEPGRGRFIDAPASGVTLDAPAAVATFADYDNDGHLDLYVADRAGRGSLFRNLEPGRFREVGRGRGLARAGAAAGAVFADLDHDGDLDLLLTGADGNRFFRNNLDGSFREMAGAMGLAGPPGRAAAFGDLDRDGRLDLVVAGTGTGTGTALYLNQGQQRFADRAADAGLRTRGIGALALGDYDNDGHLDLFLPDDSGTGPGLYRNDGRAGFTPDDRAGALAVLAGRAVRDAAFVDVDNDGWLDLVVAVAPGEDGRGLHLFRNLGGSGGEGDLRFEDRSRLLPAIAARTVRPIDHDGDADLDLLVTGPDGIRLFRNDGGNANGWVRIRLDALRTGSGKNNSFGIGARLELRAGPLHQARVVTSPVTLVGLGRQRQADALRVEWPNGVPQLLAAPPIDPALRESEVLKGSCAFVYTWDGTGFRFLTDVMWRSALGMPLGIMGGLAAYAPPAASREHVLIPGERLTPHEGRYRLRLTEELWETAYVDEVKLLAVDHPDSVLVVVDERFVPPTPAPGRLELLELRGLRPPAAARDGRGRDLMPLLRDRDDRYVAGLDPGRWQGVVAPHELILDLGDLADAASVHLLLTGWIFPSDASINVAISQGDTPRAASPALQVADGRGGWVTVLPDLGFPAGKDKTVVADLTGRFPPGSRDWRVRIVSGMQIYWDQARVAVGAAPGTSRVTTLAAAAADLRYRGFSRTFRKGGRYGPHWFDYDDVSAEPRWRPIEGRFTRFGDVLPLLAAPDDRYVVMAPGDEVALEFDAGALPPLPPGWRRDFLLYTDGWIKDADLNTATGTTVEPLPFHAMTRYPYGPDESYPADPGARRFLDEYLTRRVVRP